MDQNKRLVFHFIALTSLFKKNVNKSTKTKLCANRLTSHNSTLYLSGRELFGGHHRHRFCWTSAWDHLTGGRRIRVAQKWVSVQDNPPHTHTHLELTVSHLVDVTRQSPDCQTDRVNFAVSSL